jgi:hypothetical protein
MPDDYFKRLKDNGIDISKHLLIQEFSDDPEKLEFDTETYRYFRDARLDGIFQVAAKVVNPELQG